MKELQEISIKDITGFQIGNAEYTDAATGITVILPQGGACCGADIRGGGPASRENGLLNPLAANDAVHAVVLSGGSAFGLNAAQGVMQYLEEKCIGFKTADGVVPIVVESCIYDLGLVNSHIRPDAALALQACTNAEKNLYKDGNVGCGCGATVGKAYGPAHMMKAGIGSAAYQLGDIQVGAIAAVNAMGDVIDPSTGKIIAGCLNYDTNTFMNAEEGLFRMHLNMQEHTNTTIGAILTNTSFNKTELTKIAGMAHDGMARSINPVHTMFDGDTIYALSRGDVKADINVVGTLAAKAFAKAVVNAAKNAPAAYQLKAFESLSETVK